MSRLDFDSHRRDALVENATFLMDRGGLDLNGAARRLGVNPDALEKDIQRRRRREQSHPATAAGAGEAP